MHIYIPSRGRYSSSDMERSPALDFSDEWCAKMSYVVYEDEYEQYAAEIDRNGLFKFGVNLLIVPRDVVGIAAKRKFIGEYALHMGHETFGMFDDDIHFIVRRSPHATGLRPVFEDDTDEMMTVVEHRLLEYVHVGISFRQGNNNMDVGYPISLVGENERIARAAFFQTGVFNSAEHCRVEVMEDVDVSLQLLRRGYKNCNLGFWAQDQKMTNAPGGCSVFRTHEIHEQAAREIVRLHPGYTSLRHKQNKTGGAFGSRTEVTVQWKQAYKMGQRV